MSLPTTGPSVDLKGVKGPSPGAQRAQPIIFANPFRRHDSNSYTDVKTIPSDQACGLETCVCRSWLRPCEPPWVLLLRTVPDPPRRADFPSSAGAQEQLKRRLRTDSGPTQPNAAQERAHFIDEAPVHGSGCSFMFNPKTRGPAFRTKCLKQACLRAQTSEVGSNRPRVQQTQGPIDPGNLGTCTGACFSPARYALTSWRNVGGGTRIGPQSRTLDPRHVETWICRLKLMTCVSGAQTADPRIL